MAKELHRLKKDFESGRKGALREALNYCEQTDTPKPPWLNKALVKFAQDRINQGNKGGRPNERLRDIGIAVVEKCIRDEKRGVFGRTGQDGIIRPPGSRAKSKRLPPEEADKQISEMLSRDLTDEDLRNLARLSTRAKKKYPTGSDIDLGSLEKEGEKLKPSTIRRILKRAKKKYPEVFPINLSFLPPQKK